VVIDRGSIWWADLGEPRGSESGYRRPLLVIQADAFNRSRIQTVIAAVLTTNLRLVDAPGNVLVPATTSGLRRDSVANVSQLITVNREDLQERSGQLDAETMRRVNAGLRLVLEL
jgi:mRNA interferase MazF